MPAGCNKTAQTKKAEEETRSSSVFFLAAIRENPLNQGSTFPTSENKKLRLEMNKFQHISDKSLPLATI